MNKLDDKLVKLFLEINERFIPISDQERENPKLRRNRFDILEKEKMIGFSYSVLKWRTDDLYNHSDRKRDINYQSYSDLIIERVNSGKYPSLESIAGERLILDDKTLKAGEDSKDVPWLYLKRCLKKQAELIPFLIVKMIELKDKGITKINNKVPKRKKKEIIELTGRGNNTLRYIELRFPTTVKEGENRLLVYCHKSETYLKVYKAKNGFLLSIDRVIKLYQKEEKEFLYTLHKYGYYFPFTLLEGITLEALNGLTPIGEFNKETYGKLRRKILEESQRTYGDVLYENFYSLCQVSSIE